MTHSLGLLSIALLGFCILAEAGRELGFKIAAASAGAKENFALSLLQEPALWVAIALGIAEIVVWILVLQHTPLAIAYPIVALAYVAVPLAGVVVLRERLSKRQIAGCVLIAIGAGCVGLSGAGA